MLKLKFVWSSFTLLSVHHVFASMFCMIHVFLLFLFSFEQVLRIVCFQWEKLTTTDWECTPPHRTDDGANTQQYASFKGMWPLKNYYIAYYTDSTVCWWTPPVRSISSRFTDLLERTAACVSKLLESVSLSIMLRANLLSRLSLVP